ncbi:MAG: restriction endonuclease subunit S [Methylomonas sp.]|nr:restriction endonuclease subunit S [Methylomonas sp.]
MNSKTNKTLVNQELPDGWSWVSLGETGEYINGFAFKPNHRESEGLPIIRIQNLTDELKPLNLTNFDVPPEYKVSSGDLLVSWSATLDVFIWHRGPALVNQHIFKVVPETRVIHNRLLFYWLKIAIEQLQNTEHLHGSTMKHINRGPFMAHKLPLPPANEQTRIVEKLEELLSDLDAGVAELKAAQKKLLQYRQSLMKSAVEGALTAEWRKTHQPEETGAQLLERILKQRRAHWEAKQLAKFEQQGKTPPKGWQDKYPEPVKPDNSDLPELPELPEGWVWASAEQICDFITKGTTPTKGMDGDSEKTIPFLRVTNLTANGTLDMSDKVFVSENTHSGFLARSKVYPGDVLMNIVGPPLGQVSVVPSLFNEWNINQAIAIFRALEGVLPEFICVCLLSPFAQHWLQLRSKTTAGQTNLTLEVCRSLPIPLPPKSEQHELAKLTEAGVDSIYEQINAIHISLKQSAAQRKNILKAAFSGQLVPQDPNDEPASVLLERIRNERQHAKTPARRSRRRTGEGISR